MKSKLDLSCGLKAAEKETNSCKEQTGEGIIGFPVKTRIIDFGEEVGERPKILMECFQKDLKDLWGLK